MEGRSEILTIMFIDIAGYTKTTARLGRDSLNTLHETFDNLVLPVFQKYNGTVIKKIGDAFLITFKSSTDAIWCGIQLQKAFFEHNKAAKSKINIRVALHTGEVLHRKNDIYGDAVNAAARIEGVADAGQIVFSESVFLSMNKNEIPFTFLGSRNLKGLKYPIKLFRVKGRYDDIGKFKKKVKRKISNLFGALIWMVIIIVLIGLLIYAFYNYQNWLKLFL